jgi:hypothetical protein
LNYKLEDLEIIEIFKTRPGPLVSAPEPFNPTRLVPSDHTRRRPDPTTPLSSQPDHRRLATAPRAPHPYPLAPPSTSTMTQAPKHPPSSALCLLERMVLASSQITSHREAPTSSMPSASSTTEGLPIAGHLRPRSGPDATSPSSASAPHCSPTHEPELSTSGLGHRR